MRSQSLQRLARRVELKKAADEKIVDQALCDKEIDEIHATINKNQEEYDKQLLTLSSGFLLLSLAFVKDIVHTDQAIWRGLLYGSFVTLGFCVLLVLASFQVSIFGHDKAKDYWENRKDGDAKLLFPYGFAKKIRLLNIATGVTFMLGIILCMAFVIINLHREATMSNKPIAKDGLNTRVPAPLDVLQKGANMKVPPPPPKQQSTTTPKK
jgi:hypothetical protein